MCHSATANDVSLSLYGHIFTTPAHLWSQQQRPRTRISHTTASTTENVSNTNAMSHKNRVEPLFISLLGSSERKNPNVMIFNASSTFLEAIR